MRKVILEKEKLNILKESVVDDATKVKKARQGIIPYEDDNYTLGFDASGYGGIGENLEQEVTSDEVDLSSFKLRNQLNPKFWVNGKLNSKVRLRLLDIADDFWDSLNIGWVEPSDIIMTGSLANYNWSKHSDIDLHLLVDFSKVDDKIDLVKEFFDSKKIIWNDEHENLRIYGYPVELYVQDVNEEHNASGIYSLDRNSWIVEPSQGTNKPIQLNKYIIKDKAAYLMTLIDKLCDEFAVETDPHKIDILSNKVKKLFDKIKKMRKIGLEEDGEMSVGNIVFKTLRRFKYLDKLYDLKSKTYDFIKSIK